jgi:threonylcarbamoyladenosine tRNA methylthiotransferase MtaB
MISQLKGKKICIIAMGCRSNQSEADSLASMLQAAGADIVSEPPFDGAVLVTCTVTAVADKKSRQLLRRLRRQAPQAVIVATGCWAQQAESHLAQVLGVDFLVGNRQKWQIPSLFSMAFSSNQPVAFTDMRSDVLRDAQWDHLFQYHPLLHSRAFVKIQDGCNHFCTYCIIPFVRGNPVSRPLNDLLKEVCSIVDSGCSEIVLTGVHLGLYGKYGEVSLGEVVRQIGAISGVKRIRFGSLEPFGIDDELLSSLAETPQFCPHLHLPLQSGDDGVLEKMARGYSVNDYMTSVKKVRRFLGDNVHISTDILVGFPGEDEKAFANTLALMENVKFGKVHVFPYSRRKGTKAASLGGQIQHEIIQERVHRVLETGEKLLNEYCSQWIGKTFPILIEEAGENESSGLAPFFVKAVVPRKMSVGQIIEVSPRKYASEQFYA